MTMAEFVVELKGRFVDLTLPFQDKEYEGTLNEALRKVSRHSGKTHIYFSAGASEVINLSAQTAIRVVAQVYPSVTNVGSSEFDVFSPTWIVGPTSSRGNFYVRTLEDLMLRKAWLTQMRSAFGSGFDWWWDQTNRKLYINQASVSRLDGYIIEYLPDWARYLDIVDDVAGEIDDVDIQDDLLDLAELMTREDVGRILLSGEAFGLEAGDGDRMLEESTSGQDDIITRLRNSNPLLGIDKA